jgi:hypothetical protein
MATAPREIRVVVREGAVFRCRPDWTVDEAEVKIRAKYGLEVGGTEDQVRDLKGTDVIGNAVGDLTFVGGRALPPQPAATAQPAGMILILICGLSCIFIV